MGDILKLKSLGLILVSMLFMVFGCSKNEKDESKLALPEDIPNFVEESDFEQVNWNKKAVMFNGNKIAMKINQVLLVLICQA